MGVVRLFDGLLSAIRGAERAAAEASPCYFPHILTDEQIDSAFRASWLMRKIVTKPATEMTREGRDWQADKADIEKLEAEEKRLALWQKLQLAEVFRGLGGAGMVLYVRGDDQGTPLDPKRIAVGALTAVHLWHRSAFTLGQPILDWTDPWFGHPSYYEMAGIGQYGEGVGAASTRFHPSRVVAFRGKPITGMAMAGAYADRWWWGDSAVEAVKEAVDNVHIGEKGFAKLIRRASIRRLAVPKLLEKVATAGAEAQFAKRVAAVAAGENNDDITWLDAGGAEGEGAETMSDHQVTWTGIPDIKASNLAVAAAAANMPATVLLGKSPDGQNATGSSDQRLWEQEVKSRQDLELKPCLGQIDAALIPSALGKPGDSIWWEYAPLSVATEKEEAETFKTTVDAIDKLDQTGLVPKIALEKGAQNLLEERGWLPGIGDALAELDEDERFPSLSEPDDPAEDPSAIQAPVAKGGGQQSGRPGGAAPKRLPARRAVNDARFLADAEPRTLYVSRKLLNADELIRWAKAQGLETTVPADKMHVTIAFSRAPVDWFSVGSDWSGDEDGKIRVKPGGPRTVERLGEGDAVVLRFTSDDLEWRHKRIVEAGASWDWPEYKPHVTITWEAPGVDVSGIDPYTGPLVFGPELFAEVDEDWRSTITEDGGAPTGDRPFSDAFNPGQPRDKSGRWTSGAISAHVEEALADRGSHKATSLGGVSEANADAVLKQTGVDISGYERILGSSEIRHAILSHGDPTREAARGQVAIERGDFARIPAIVEAAHKIEAHGAKRHPKGLRLAYTANMGKHEYHYTELVRRNSIVALKTIRKRVR